MKDEPTNVKRHRVDDIIQSFSLTVWAPVYIQFIILENWQSFSSVYSSPNKLDVMLLQTSNSGGKPTQNSQRCLIQLF